MSLNKILEICAQQNIQISRGQGELIVKAPKGAMTAEIANLLRAHKQELLAALADDLIKTGSEKRTRPYRITPEMLTLVGLSQAEIDIITAGVAGGVVNIKDVYPLAPLQEGILFHHLAQAKGDNYLLPNIVAFDSRERLQGFVAAMQVVLDRHDILRTGFFWQGLDVPVQVVCRRADLPVEQLHFADGDKSVLEHLQAHMDPLHFRIDISRAPLVRCFIADDPANNRHLLAIAIHHLIADHTSLELIIEESIAVQAGHVATLPVPVPFRNFIAQTTFGVTREQHQAYFSALLADVRESTAPFDIHNTQGNDKPLKEVHEVLPAALCQNLRRAAKQHGVSAASIFHLAWGMVLSRLVQRADVVFGTVLFGRMQGGQSGDRGIGLYINTLPVRLSIDGAAVGPSLRETHRQLINLLRHEHASLAQAQKASGVAAGAPLFTTILNYRYSVKSPAGTPGADLGFEPLCSRERTNYPLSIAIDDTGEGFIVTLQTEDAVPAERVVAYVHQALDLLVADLMAESATPLVAMDVIPPREKFELTQFPDNATPYAQRPIHLAIEHQAAENAAAVALIAGDETLTYEQLNARANQLAHCLRERGVTANSLVAVCLERNAQMLVALLAILKAGGAYVPLDPAYPADRLAHMVQDSQPVLCIAQHGTVDLVKHLSGGQCFDLDAESAALARQPLHNPSAAGCSGPDDLAYVIYTSGSTGKPKGVMISQRNLANFIWAMVKEPGISRADTLLSVTSLSFDIAALELYLPLVAGARVVLASRADATNPARLQILLEQHQVTLMQATPSTWRLLADHGWPRLNRPLRLLCGGEPLPRDLARRLLEVVPGIWNMYGPTETTVWSTVKYVCAVDQPITIGKPIANTRCYILDGQMRPVPPGCSGELYIGGDGVARGYRNRADLTRERFVPDPFSGAPAVMYKTGDLCRLNGAGEFEHLGRNDFQVKIRGFRIELGEIETILNSIAGVREAAVVALEDSRGEKQLSAFIVARENAPINPARLRELLLAELPVFMVPNFFSIIASLPLTPNGKIDRQTLTAMHQAGDRVAVRDTSREFLAPASEIEARLHAQWQHLLSLPAEAISCDDDFFALGGTSLGVIRLISYISREFGISLGVNDFLQQHSITHLAAAIAERKMPAAEVPVVIFNDRAAENVFCVPGVHGHALVYNALAQQLPQYRLCGLEPISVHGHALVDLGSVERMCQDYLGMIKKLQPAGPYRLLGHSHGGLVALHLASLLQRQGDTVESVCLIDTVAVLDRNLAERVAQRRNAHHTDAEYVNFIFSNFEKFLGRQLDMDSGKIGAMAAQQRLEHVAGELDKLQLFEHCGAHFVEQYLARRKAHEDTLSDYLLAGALPHFSGRVCLIKAADAVAEMQDRVPEDYGWRPHLHDHLQSFTVAGNHENLIAAPHVSHVAEALRQFFSPLSTGAVNEK